MKYVKRRAKHHCTGSALRDMLIEQFDLILVRISGRHSRLRMHWRAKMHRIKSNTMK